MVFSSKQPHSVRSGCAEVLVNEDEQLSAVQAKPQECCICLPFTSGASGSAGMEHGKGIGTFSIIHSNYSFILTPCRLAFTNWPCFLF